jgi:hypothetical protein
LETENTRREKEEMEELNTSLIKSNLIKIMCAFIKMITSKYQLILNIIPTQSLNL